jgi:recombination protein RecA
MDQDSLHAKGVVRARDLLDERRWSEEFGLSVLTERLSELFGTCVLTAAFLLVREAQRQEEPALWIAASERTFFPPDAAENGVDLSRLPLIQARGGEQAVQLADWGVRSGGFGLVIIDLDDTERLGNAALGRMLRLAEKHRTAVVFLRDAQDGSLGSLVSFRAKTSVRSEGLGQYVCEVEVVKDRRGKAGRRHGEPAYGPLGMR